MLCRGLLCGLPKTLIFWDIRFTEAFANDRNRSLMWLAFLKKIGHSEKIPLTQVLEIITTVLKPAWESLNRMV